ncbi:hypothetical protein [Haliangium sp.]|uniref:hypothetical protein n=1 Tax=Haliangium sp. TaxID=2663208 RepID=UPI003D0CF6A8
MRAPTLTQGLGLSLLATVLLGGCAAEDSQQPVYGETIAYAEGVYGNYEAAAGERIGFTVDTVERGHLNDIAEIPVNDLLGVPEQWIRMSSRGTDIVGVTREARDSMEDEWQADILLEEFETLGRSLDDATYRVLSVGVAFEGESRAHRALEVCWARDGYCIVMDPVVLQADAFSHQRERLAAEGWAPMELLDVPEGELQAQAVTAAGTCSLNSNPGFTRITANYPGYAIEYKNVFGMVLVRKDVGAQQAGVSCFVNGAGACVSSGFGFSSTSSCFGNLGYTCDCENTGNQIGNSADGSATKTWAETRCAHRAFLSASVAFSRNGEGVNFNIQWDTAGSVDTNGGQLFDSCGFH